MAVRAPDRPTISCVYAAFDAACQRVFRRAMELSSGSVVRVGDLVQALAELARSAADGLIPGGWQPPPRPASREAWLTPMSNEPALRACLEQAYLGARESGHPVVITPRRLWESALKLGHLPRIVPRMPAVPPPSPVTAAQFLSPVAALVPVESLIEQTLSRWLVAHAGSDPAVRNSDVDALRPLVQQIETRGVDQMTNG